MKNVLISLKSPQTTKSKQNQCQRPSNKSKRLKTSRKAKLSLMKWTWVQIVKARTRKFSILLSLRSKSKKLLSALA